MQQVKTLFELGKSLLTSYYNKQILNVAGGHTYA